MLTGALPFQASTAQETMIKRLTDHPRTLAEMRPDASWPAPVQAALDRALQRKAEDRYAHATDFSSDLTRAVTAMPAGATGAGAGAGGGGVGGGGSDGDGRRDAVDGGAERGGDGGRWDAGAVDA